MAVTRFVKLWNEVWEAAQAVPRPDVEGLLSDAIPLCTCGGSPMVHDFTRRGAPGTSVRNPCEGFSLSMVRFEQRRNIDVPYVQTEV